MNSNLLFKVIAGPPGEKPHKRVARAEPGQTLRDFLRQTLRHDGIEALPDYAIRSVTSHCGVNLVTVLSATVEELVGFLEEATSKTLSVELESGYVIANSSSSAAHKKKRADTDGDGTDDNNVYAASSSKKKKKKRRTHPSTSTAAKKKSRADTTDEGTDGDDANDGTTVAADTSSDAAIAMAAAALFWEYIEGGNTYEARVVSHMQLRCGSSGDEKTLKFLVEWRRKAAADSASAASSSSSSATRTAPMSTSWIPLRELIVPSAALEYVNSDLSPGWAGWERDAARKQIMKLYEEIRADNTHRKDLDEPESCREVDFCCLFLALHSATCSVVLPMPPLPPVPPKPIFSQQQNFSGVEVARDRTFMNRRRLLNCGFNGGFSKL